MEACDRVPPLQRGVIKIVEIIDDRDLVLSEAKSAIDHVRADEALRRLSPRSSSWCEA
jgi:hypothetical protein